MPVSPSFSDLIGLAEAEMLERRPDLKLRDGDVTEADMHASAIIGDAVLRFGWQAFKETFLDGAEGDALSALVSDRLNIDRRPASRAVGAVAFMRGASPGLAGSIPSGTRIGTGFDASGAQVVYTTNADVVVALSSTGPYAVAVTAEVGGVTGNVAAGLVTEVLSTLFDTFTVSNSAEMAGGLASETDEELRVRARTFYGVLRRGTLAALEYGAKQAPGVAVASARESDSSGIVYVTVSDADGGSNAEMIAGAVLELEQWRVAGPHVQVLGGHRVLVDLTILIRVRSGQDKLDVPLVASLLVDAATARINKGRGEEDLYLDGVIAAIIGVYPDDILDVEFAEIIRDSVVLASNIDPIPAGTATVLRAGTISVAEAEAST